MTLLDANLDMMAKIQPALAEELRRQPVSRHIDLVPLEDGIPAADAIIVVGLPARETWQKLLGVGPATVIVSHSDLPGIKAYLTLVDLREALAGGKVSFAVGEEGVLQVLNDIFGTLYRRQVTLFGMPGTPDHASALKDMQFFDTLCASNRATLDQFAEDWQSHVSDNLKDFLCGPFLQDAAGSWSGGEAVIVAAGPSVDDEEIPAAFKGSPVIACDTAVPVLATHGVTPELIVTLDASQSNQAYLQNLPGPIYETSVLCVTPLIDRKVYLPFRNVVFYSYGHPTLDHLKDHGLPFEPMASGGSVALTAVDIAQALGVKRAFLLGYDFQYYPYRTHARGTGAALRGMKSVGRFQSIEQVLYEYQSEMETRTPSRGPEAAAVTDRKFQKWRDWLELYVKNNDIKLFQMSGRAVPISGIPLGKPSGSDRTTPLNFRRRPVAQDLRRELKFLVKEIEMAESSPPAELLRRVSALPRVNKCLGYCLAWLADKPPEEAASRLGQILRSFKSGVTEAVTHG